MERIAIIGAGLMGSGIAYVSAVAGFEVILNDTNLENAQKGKDFAAKIATKIGIPSAIIENIQLQQPLKDCDWIIEAVYEDLDLKRNTIKLNEGGLKKNGIFASNTSTLPISLLAEASSYPERFVGLHFFSPVNKMALLEVIRGKFTSESTLKKALNLAKQLGKIPITVNDSMGFYTTRIFATYTAEGIQMLGEGASALAIEKAAQFAGMPVGPLAVTDEISIDLFANIRKQILGDEEIKNDMAYEIAQKMVKIGRKGRKSGAGFYDYPAQQPKKLHEGIFAVTNLYSIEIISDRLLYVQAIESYRCLEANILDTYQDGNIGSVLGWGFPKEGTLCFPLRVGLDSFFERASVLAASFGKRFLINATQEAQWRKVIAENS